MNDKMIELLVGERLMQVRRMVADFYYIQQSFNAIQALIYLKDQQARAIQNINKARYNNSPSRRVAEQKLEMIEKLRAIVDETIPHADFKLWLVDK